MDFQMTHIFALLGVLLVIGLIITVIVKIFQSIVFGIIAAILICVLFTVFFGEGYDLVHYFTSFMDDEVGVQIEESYDYYKDKEKETPLLDSDKVTEYVTNTFSDLKPFADSIFEAIPEPPG